MFVKRNICSIILLTNRCSYYIILIETNVRIIRSKIFYINIFIKTSDDLDPYYNEENDAGIDNYIGRYVI